MNNLKLFQTHSDYETFVSGDTMVRPNVSHCITENEVHYNPWTDPFNGHVYVDLGLPSGTKWAKMNVGAESETDYGLYFQWGDTQGYADASTKAFGWSDYKFGTYNESDTTDRGMTKYNKTDGLTNLELTDDAASVNWGGDWHTPTKEQCGELLNPTYITNEWVSNYNNSGVDGRLFTSVSNGNTMFIPAAGGYRDGESINIGVNGYITTSTLYSDAVNGAWYFYANSSGAAVSGYGFRCMGRTIRGVVGPMNR